MRLSELVGRVKTVIDSETARKWNEQKIARALNDMQRSLVREMVKIDLAYVNHRFVLGAAAARRRNADEYSFRLPWWVISVTGVRESQPASGGRQPLVAWANRRSAYSGVEFTASNELTFWRMGEPRSWQIECAKLPALMTRGTLPSQVGVAASALKLDADSSADAVVYPHETHLDAYAGGLFEITGSTPPSARVGQLLRCIGSDGDVAGRTLTMEEAWASAPVAGDTYEMHAEIPEQHMNLLVLLAARRFFAQTNNLPGIAALGPELSEEHMAFRNAIQPRQLAQPHYIGQSNDDDWRPVPEMI